MPTETAVMERIHAIENRQSVCSVEMLNMGKLVAEMQKTLKAVEVKMTLATGAFLAIEIISKLWR